MPKHTNTLTLAKALRVIASDMESADGLPQLVLLEAAERLQSLENALADEKEERKMVEARLYEIENELSK